MSKNTPTPTPEKNPAAAAEFRDARALKPHPVLASIWMLDAVEGDTASEEYAAGLTSVMDHGVRRPIAIVTGTDLCADGRHRLSWACRAAEATGDDARYQVPVVEISQEEAMELIHDELFARRSMNKGQKAWAFLTINAALLQHGGGRPAKSRSGSGITAEDAAKSAGVSLRMMQWASQLHGLVEKFKDSREKIDGKLITVTAQQKREAVESRIWQGHGLETILADLKPAPNDAKQQQDTPEPDPNLDVLATEATARFSQMLLDWETEVITGESHRLLPSEALLNTTRRTCSLTTALLEGLIQRPDILPAHKAQILSELAATLTAARESLGGGK